MGGRIIFEVLACNKSNAEPQRGEEQNEPRFHDRFVRLNINDGVTALPDCADGPGGSCPLALFVERTKRRGEEGGNFKEVCGLEEGVAGGISFLRQG